MKLNYYILWVEDDNSWFETTSELFEGIVKDHGFHPIIERKKNLDEVMQELVENGLKKYDIFLIDFKLRNSKDGDSIIDFLRDKNVYTDIIFYSSDKQSIIDSIKEHLFEGVYHSDRNDIEGKFEKVFLTTIKKIEEINSMRGLIVGETSDLDAMIEENLASCIQLGLIKAFEVDKFVSEKITEKEEQRCNRLKEDYKNGGIAAILPRIDAVRKWELLRGILKIHKDKHGYISGFITINGAYQAEVIEVRNKFAHAKVITNEDGKEFLKAQVGDAHYEFNEESFRTIREALKKHRDSLIGLKNDCINDLGSGEKLH
jgi:ASC-1-like (ASCH) protein